MITIRSPFCGYNAIQFVELNGEDLSRYSNRIESVSLRKCPYDHRLTNGAFSSAITVTNISQTVLPTGRRRKSTGIDMEQNYVTATLCGGATRRRRPARRIKHGPLAPTSRLSLISRVSLAANQPLTVVVPVRPLRCRSQYYSLTRACRVAKTPVHIAPRFRSWESAFKTVRLITHAQLMTLNA